MILRLETNYLTKNILYPIIFSASPLQKKQRFLACFCSCFLRQSNTILVLSKSVFYYLNLVLYMFVLKKKKNSGKPNVFSIFFLFF